MKLTYYLDKGGFIMYILSFLSVVGISILIWKLLIFILAKKNITKISKNIAGKNITDNDGFSLKIIEDEISIVILKLEKGLETIKTISTIAPLLGLLGTVIGILDSFEKIASKGMDSTMFASGISLALITTIGGLIVAIPHTIGYNYLIKMLDFIEVNINKKTIELKLGTNSEKA